MKTAIVTGASYGIGKSVAGALLGEGWKVYGLSRSKPEFIDKHFVWLQCDLSQSEQIAKCLEVIDEPALDAFVSNAGVCFSEAASAVSKTSYEATFSVNVLAPMLLVGALRDKIARATIISISSVSDRIAESDMALYCSSKAANTLYFNTLAEELKSARVYTLLPDYVDTPMQHKSNDSNSDFDWAATIKSSDMGQLCGDLISGRLAIESGANIIVVTESLKDDLKSVEKLYGFNTDTSELHKL